MSAKSRLGKGLGALFPTLPSEEALATPQEVSRETTPVVNDATTTSLNNLLNPHSIESRERKKVKGKQSSQESSPSVAPRARHAQVRGAMPSLQDVTRPIDFFFAQGEGQGFSVAKEHVVQQEQSEKKPALKPVEGGYLDYLKPADIVANAHQPRTVFDEEELQGLADSIREVGVLQPIVVRKIAKPNEEQTAHYELIMGERRWRACQLAGLDVVPAIVRTTSDEHMLRDALLENLHRVALNPLEEAAAYAQMIDEFGLTQAQLSQSVSKSRPQIANTLRLLNLPTTVQKQVAAGLLSAGHARALLGLSTQQEMEALAKRIVEEGLSVRSTEEIVSLASSKNDEGLKKVRRQRNDHWAHSPIRERLEQHFATKVAIKGTPKHGRIEIVFASEEEMKRIVNLLAPDNEHK